MTHFGLTVFSYVPTALVSLKSYIDAGVPMQLDHEVDEGIFLRRREPLDKLETLWTPNLRYATLQDIRQVFEVSPRITSLRISNLYSRLDVSTIGKMANNAALKLRISDTLPTDLATAIHMLCVPLSPI
ncbi:hypothetical protein BGX24_003894 [Mortierella sp. AD032]|nr:hypothetical protein BGX24_003894 [Mortierella sp. AD032]